MVGTAEERMEELQQLYPKWEEDTLWTRFRKSADRFSQNDFIVYQEKTYTYAQAAWEVDCLARGCIALGIRNGDHVAVHMRNSPEYVFLIFALAKVGAVKVSVNVKLAKEEAAYILEHSNSQYLFSQSLEKISQSEILEKLKGCVVLQRKGTEGFPEFVKGWEDFLEMGENSRRDAYPAEVSSLSLSDILYTSGSTSFPKGVTLTHDMLLRSSFGTCYTRRMELGRRILLPLALCHIMAYNEGLLAALWVGGTIILTDRKAEGSYILRLLQESRANDIVCVPIIMLHLLEQGKPKPEMLPHLHAAYWASTCPDWIWDEGKKKLGITDVTTGYGMTECGSTTTIVFPEESDDFVKTCHGKPKECGAAGVQELGGRLLETRICDMETGEDLSAGNPGELKCRGVTVTPGYYHASGQNANAFDADGWFSTGDIGYFDEEGHFIFQGRKSDTYKMNGENVSPQYINLVIGRCPEVRAVESVGIHNEKCGEIGVAFIDAVDNTTQVKNNITAYAKAHLADFQIPKYLVLSQSAGWPRTVNGKIKSCELKKTAAEKIEHLEAKDKETARKEIIWI